MMEALLNPLKRSHQIEKRLVVLARDDAPVGKAAAVHIGLDTKIDRMILISSTQEICMQRVDKSLVSECPLCGGKCLRNHLPPEDPADSAGTALATPTQGGNLPHTHQRKQPSRRCPA